MAEPTPQYRYTVYGPSGQPQPADIDQDKIGDCYLMSALGTVARTNPELIKNLISYDKATDSFKVTLFEPSVFNELSNWGKPNVVDHYTGSRGVITVTRADVLENFQRHGGSKVDNDPSGGQPAWPAIVETAFAKMWDLDPNRNGLSGGYAKIVGGHAQAAFYALTGERGQNLLPNDLTPTQMAGKIATALKEGRPVVLDTQKEPAIKDAEGRMITLQDGLVDGHAYMVEGIRYKENGAAILTLRNPWGHNNSDEKQQASPTIEVSLDHLYGCGGLSQVEVGPVVRGQQRAAALTSDADVNTLLAAAEQGDLGGALASLQQGDFAAQVRQEAAAHQTIPELAEQKQPAMRMG